ncbi:MFS transporter [Georgenia ruanii]|uniref:MFS transporter n=1 Tax=Georgenia ruanii TaxID=348442 RepID=A0A7J9UVY7_9MICO|nr:MFS transporter [Georgenia ruanii]MPV88050.1 MFS transporter [Georgenia ruanii]
MSFSSPHGRPLRAGLLLAGIVLVAANLRPVITAVGPVLPLMGADTGLSPAALGLLAAVPVAGFGLVSPVVHPLAERFGMERVVLAAMIVLGVGTVVRSLPGSVAPLWVGTGLIGASIAVGNVLLPVAVKKDFPLRLTVVTGVYIAVQSVFAGLASGFAMPVAAASSWRVALGLWVVLVALAIVVWLPRLRSGREVRVVTHRPRPTRGAPVWRSGLAWQVAVYMGLQSTVYYTLVNWLPTLEHDTGVSPVAAGWHLFLYMFAAIASNLAAPALMRVGGDQRFASTLMPVLMITGMVGLVLAPGLVVLWVVLVGLGSGGSIVIAMSLVGLRSPDHPTASRLSSMAQGVGYGSAAAGVLLAGVLRDLTGPGPLLLLCLAGVTVAQFVLGLGVGRNRVLPG